MRAGTEKKIYTKIRSKNLAIQHVCEVGVWLPEMSNILDFIIRDKVRTTLVEPDPKSIAAIRTYFRDYPNVGLLPYAAFDHHGMLELVQRNASTFVSTLPYSPAQVNDHYRIKQEDRFTVECRRFDELDDGSIGLLSVDTEGSEWYVIQYLKSRPLVISVEMHGKSYLNPYYTEIAGWMAREGYEEWYMDKTDIVYYKKGAFTVTAAEKWQLAWMDFHVRVRRARKRLFGGNKSGK
ncbi:MAG TPA: FkbM family methyltransferase [Puia sp.]|nr:FkbM family methyltransferase [Puia sp.]